MSLEAFQIAELRELFGTFPGSAAQTGCTYADWSISTSGTSLLTGCTPVSSSFQLFAAFGNFGARVSSGVSIVWDHSKGGSDYDTVIASTTLSSEMHWSYVPSAPLIVPQGAAIKIRTAKTDVAGTTRYVTMVVGY